jgi:SP family sugar porter-like MFS transporter
LNAALGAAGTFWTYAAVCLAGLLFLYFRLPETRGKTLEEIEINLRMGKAPENEHAHRTQGI